MLFLRQYWHLREVDGECAWVTHNIIKAEVLQALHILVLDKEDGLRRNYTVKFFELLFFGLVI